MGLIKGDGVGSKEKGGGREVSRAVWRYAVAPQPRGTVGRYLRYIHVGIRYIFKTHRQKLNKD